MFEWCVVGCGSKNIHRTCVRKRDWSVCSERGDHSKLNSEHNWGGGVNKRTND